MGGWERTGSVDGLFQTVEHALVAGGLEPDFGEVERAVWRVSGWSWDGWMMYGSLGATRAR